MTKTEKRSLRNGLLFMSPWIIGMLVFTAYPLLSSLYYSFTQYNVLTPPKMVGLANYQSLFADPLFYKAVWNTVYFVVVSIPLITLLSIGMALLLNTSAKYVGIYRTIFYLPVVVPGVAAAVLWRWVLDPNYGLLNTILTTFGVSSPSWFTDGLWVKPGLILMSTWAIGNTILMYLAALQDVPNDLLEAADIDGANWFTKISRIVIPMISPILFLNIILGIIGGFQYFTQAFTILQGSGPDQSGLFYTTYLYQNAFTYFKMGYASALGWVLCVIILILTLVVFKSSVRWVYYRGESN